MMKLKLLTVCVLLTSVTACFDKSYDTDKIVKEMFDTEKHYDAPMFQSLEQECEHERENGTETGAACVALRLVHEKHNDEMFNRRLKY